MESSRHSRAGLRRALAAAALGVVTIGSLALLPRPAPAADAASWPFTRIAESARLRAGLSAVQPGDIAVIQFSLGSFRGSDIFLPGAPVSVEIGCASRTAVDEGSTLDPTAHGTLDYDAARDVYTYFWATSGTWENTCRRLSLEFTDGSVHEVFVWFGDPFGVVAEAQLAT
jgi:hypothetical protein